MALEYGDDVIIKSTNGVPEYKGLEGTQGTWQGEAINGETAVEIANPDDPWETVPIYLPESCVEKVGMKKKAAHYTGNVDMDFEETALMPSVVADTVGETFTAEMGKPELASDYSKYLMEELQRVYENNPSWAEKIVADTDNSRDVLYSFMTHWAAAFAVSRGDMSSSDAVEYQRSKGVFSASLKKKAELLQTEKIYGISSQLFDEAGEPESGEYLLQEPWASKFIEMVKSTVGPVDDDVIRELEDNNFHSEIRLLVMNGLTTGDYYSKDTYKGYSSTSNTLAMKRKADITNFLNDYIICALWSSTDNSDDSGGRPLDDKYTKADFAPGEEDKAKTDCENFMQQAEAANLQLNDDAGHDFWLTRNGHGAGFWDGDYDKATGDKLTEIAKRFGEVNVEIGDDEKLYFFP